VTIYREGPEIALLLSEQCLEVVVVFKDGSHPVKIYENPAVK
jgi:hypothetical protein